MLFPTIVFTLFAIALGWVVYWTWQQREAARKQAELAQEQAKSQAELAVLGERVKAVAHDVDNLFAILISNLSSAHHLGPEELRELLGDVEDATSRASRILRSIRDAKVGPSGRRSVQPIVELVAALLARGEVPIDVEQRGTLTYVGSEEDALRVVQNLVGNAVREAKTMRGGRVKIVVDEGRLSVTNPTRNVQLLEGNSIYEKGVSGAGSSGLGLAIAKERAGVIGWELSHSLHGNEVHFVVEGRRKAN